MTRRPDLAQRNMERRILTDEQAQHAHRMKVRGMTWCAIAAWFSRNGTPVSYKAVKAACERFPMQAEAA